MGAGTRTTRVTLRATLHPELTAPNDRVRTQRATLRTRNNVRHFTRETPARHYRL